MSLRSQFPISRLLRPLILTAASFTGLLNSACSDDWPQFLGAHRNGTAAETELISEFPPDGPDVLWRTPLGVGMSSPIVSGNLLWTTYQDSANQYAVCLSLRDGSLQWKSELAPAYTNAMGNGPRATPALHDSRLFVYTGEGILSALDSRSGQKIWSVHVPESLNTKPSEYGMSSSPIVTEGVVVVHAGADNAAVAAYRVDDGRPAWTAGKGRAGYSSPALMTLAGREQIVSLTAEGAIGMNPQSGDILWSYPFRTDYDCNTAQPVQTAEDLVLISAGENHGSVMLKIEAPADGAATAATFRVTEATSSLGRESVLRAEWQTPVIHGDYLYGLDNAGSAGPITNLVCLRLPELTPVWRRTRFGKSNLTLADGRLYISTMDGELAVVDADPSEFRLNAKAGLIGMTRQAPVISQGRAFLRDDSEIICVRLTADPS